MKFTASVHYTLLLAVAAASICPADSNDQTVALAAERIRVEQLGISLSLPAGWHIQMLEGPAARLIPSIHAQRQLTALSGTAGREIKLWPIEIVGWTSPAISHSPQQAVAGHEELLQQRYSYERESSEPFTSTLGLSGIAVTGQIGTGQDALLVVFAGYTVGDYDIVVGTFCHPQDQEIIARFFQLLIRSVGRIGAPSIATPPPLPATPTHLPQTARPESIVSLEHPPSATQPVVSPESAVEPHRMSTPQRLASLPETDRAPSIPASLLLPEPGAPAQQQSIGETPSPASTVHPPPPEATQSPTAGDARPLG